MTTQLEDLLRQGMQRQGDGLAAPPRLLRDAARHNRRRRNGAAALVATGVVATGAGVGVSAFNGPAVHQAKPAAPTHSSAHSTSPRILTAAYVASRAETAIDASNAVLYTRSASGNGVTWKMWTDRRTGTNLGVSYDKAGNPLTATLVPGNGGRVTVVDYQTTSWWTYVPVTDPRHAPRLDPKAKRVNLNAFDTPAQIKAALADGNLTLLGQQRLPGRNTVHVTHTFDKGGLRLAMDMWIDATSYLPVRTAYQSPQLAKGQRAVNDLTWLPRTEANLAKLSLSAPTGFRHLSGPPKENLSGGVG